MEKKRHSSKEPALYEIGPYLVSSELGEKLFHCDLEACKGACCVEGDLGAPLETEELAILDQYFPLIRPYLRPEGAAAIEQQGTAVFDFTHHYSTPLVHGKECAYAIFDEKGIAKCGIQAAWEDGVIDFKKPISCHLYPIREESEYFLPMLRYDRWSVCSPACKLGKQLGIPVYEFLREPIIRKYGEAFYQALEVVFQQNEPSGEPG